MSSQPPGEVRPSRRSTHLAPALLAALFFLAAIPAPAENRTILKVFELPDPRRTDAWGKAELAVLDAFKRRHPHIELRQFSGITIEGMAMDSRVLMAVAGGVAPDVMYVNFRQSHTYIQNGFLHPLDDFVADVPDVDFALRVAPPIRPVIERRGPDGEEHVWAMPFATTIRALAYRKDLFYKAGLAPERPPATWDEFLDFARRLTMPEEGTYGMALTAGPNAAWDWMSFLWSAGGEAVARDANGEWTAVFDSDAAADAMDFYVRLVTEPWKDASGRDQEGYATRDNAQLVSSMWRQGRIGMRFVSLEETSLGRRVDMSLYGIAPVPRGRTGHRGSELNARMMGIFAEAGESNNAGLGDRDPAAVKRAAWQYIWFFDSEEARRIRVASLVESGSAKSVNPVYLRRYGYDEHLRFVHPELLSTFEQSMATGRPEPYGKNCQRVYQYLTYPMDACIQMARRGELDGTREERLGKIKQVLVAAVARTNEEMLGAISPQERAKRNRVATLVAFCVALAFCVVVRRVWIVFTPKDDPNVQGWMIKKYFYAYLLLVPALGSIALWKYVPMLMGSLMAFQDYRVVGESTWIGIQNFADVLYDPLWWAAIGKTLYYMLLMLAVGFLPPIFLAILLQEVSHGKTVYRVIYYLPAVITGIIVIYLWKLLYDPSDAGGLNQILLALGFEKKRWLQDESLAMLCCVIPTVWAGLGPGCLIYLAALKGIPDDSYEAADLDGASFLQKVVHIVFPHLKALIIIQFISAFIRASQQSGFILVMTFGGPNEQTKVAGLMIFEKAYIGLKFGIATTMAWMLGVVLLGFTVIQLKRLSGMEFKAAGGGA